jgi:hydroxymethylglutaryl-CoA reductase
MDSTSSNNSSRIPNFFRLSVAERITALIDRGLISAEDGQRLRGGQGTLKSPTADKMIENVLGVFGLPWGIALNFLINDRDYIVPLVVEEPSIVAGLSGAARMARDGGGFNCNAPEPILTGQIQIVDLVDADLACRQLEAARSKILDAANTLHPNMVARGGGARDMDTHVHVGPESGQTMVVLHIHVDTREAMGANLVNTMCEGVASLVESITGGRVHLRILSNLSDRSIVKARVRFPLSTLPTGSFSGAAVRDGIILANDLARVDPYRATTHNKGIMNGVDALALATGNDWRAIESAAHAYAARDGQYRALTRWYADDNQDLVGEIEIPIKVGTVGGSLETNPAVRLNHRLLGSPSAAELAGIMGVVGLAQNFAALRSLSTRGIQHNHMRLHARSVASTAGVPAPLFDKVVDALVDSGEIKVWKAEEIVRKLSANVPAENERSSACGKVILLGEHAVVYGQPAFAVPLPLAIESSATSSAGGHQLIIDAWKYHVPLTADAKGFAGALYAVLIKLGLARQPTEVSLFPHVPPGMGLGSSAALAVAAIRAIGRAYALGLDDKTINALAYDCEVAAHGSPSGVDNTVATYGRPLRFQRGRDPAMTFIDLPVTLPLVIGLSSQAGSTASTVADVRARRERDPARHDRMFAEIGTLTDAAVQAATAGDWVKLGEAMNICHGFLNALGLSTPELETLVHTARRAGATGAKLTGGGGGGAIVAVTADKAGQDAVVRALVDDGFAAFAVSIQTAE